MAKSVASEVSPFNREAEMSVLGAILIEPEAFGRVHELLRAEDFFREAHRVLFEVVADLDARRSTPDLVTVADELSRRGELERVGGRAFLVELMEVLPSAANVEHYARIVRDYAVRRRLAQAADEIRREALVGEEPAGTVLDRAEARVFEIGARESSRGTIHLGAVLDSAFAGIEKQVEQRGALSGLDTGYYRLNDLTGGLQDGDLIVIAARPSMGKTTFALNVALNACLISGARVLFFSLEMGEEQIARNLLCSRAEVDANRVRRGQLTDRDWLKLQEAAGQMHKAPFYIDASPGLTPSAIFSKARRLAGREKIGLIVVDYLQMVVPPPRAENRQQEISQISRAMKELARQIGCPVIALSQLNRSVDSREDHRPRLSDLRESGAIEQDADLIVFLYREDYYRGEQPAPGEGSHTELLIAKQRNGPTGRVELLFFPHRLRFENMAVEAPQ
jgi:replicative DNA helicase